MSDVEILLEYLGRQWLPIPVKEAYDRFVRGEDEQTKEIERLKARMRPDVAHL